MDPANKPEYFKDSIKGALKKSKIVHTDDGLLVQNAVLCRAMVLRYGDDNIYRSINELTKAQFSMQRMMVVDDHPAARVINDISQVKGKVIPDTIYIDDNIAYGDLLITDEKLAGKIEAGKHDLSPGYLATVIDKQGTFNDENYVGLQTDIFYDHLAVVDVGRCPTPYCGILTDANQSKNEYSLDDAIDIINLAGIDDGYIVGGIAEHGKSRNDVDIITDAEIDYSLLSSKPLHLIKDSKKPNGPAINISKLKELEKFMDSIKIMRPKKTKSKSHEIYDINDFKGFSGIYSVEPKYDGIRVLLGKSGNGIRIKTDEGNSIENKLQNVSEEARKIPYDSVILDCELVTYYHAHRGNHTDVTAYLHSKSPSEDYHIRLKPFDVLYVNGEDVRSKTLKERKELLKKVKWSEHIHPIKYKIVDGSKLISAIKDQSTSEGAMIKDMSSVYAPSGEGWYKWKRQFNIDAKVIEMKKVAGGYIYTCSAGGGEIGSTYATKIKANVGDIIEVRVDHITKTETGFSWYAPKVVSTRPDKKTADPISVLEKIAESKHKTDGIENTEDQDEINKIENIYDAGPVLSGKFVLQEHWWGKKHHFDLRFEKLNSEGKAVMIGFTLFANSQTDLKSKLSNNVKILAKQKQYHAPGWLTFNGDIKPGDAGNPTTNLVAHMRIRDKGHYTFARRENNFVDMTLDGKILNGQYFVRKVPNLKTDASEDPESGPKPGDKQPEGQASKELANNPNNKWLFWKAKEQKNDGVNTQQEMIPMDTILILDEAIAPLKTALAKFEAEYSKLDPDQQIAIGSAHYSINQLMLAINRTNFQLSMLPENLQKEFAAQLKALTKTVNAASKKMEDGATNSKLDNIGTKLQIDGISAIKWWSQYMIDTGAGEYATGIENPTKPSGTAEHSDSSIDEKPKVNEGDTMSEGKIIVDGIEYTEDTIKKLVADSAALKSVQKKATESKTKLLDEKETELKKVTDELDEAKGKLTEATAKIDEKETELKTVTDKLDKLSATIREPLEKAVVDANLSLTIEDVRAWKIDRLETEAASVADAAKIAADAARAGKTTKQQVDDAYAKVGGGK